MPNPSDSAFHEQSCAVKNPKTALFLVVCFSVILFAGWRALHKPPEHNIVNLVFYIVVAAALSRFLVTFTCWRERFVIGVVIVILLTGAATGLMPSLFSQHLEMIRLGKLALLLLALLVSLTMLVQSVRRSAA